MKIAYLTNQYPAVSHTFIRREILELERRGHELIRLTIRTSKTPLVDPLDQEETRRTVVLLNTSFLTLLKGLIRTALSKPYRFFHTFCVMLQLNRANEKSFLTHIAYLVEAVLLSDLCIKHKIQHIHVHFGTNAAAVALLTKHLTGVTFSLTIHGPEEFDGPIALSLRKKVSEASFILVISYYAKAQLHRWIDPNDWIKIHIVRCTVDDIFFHQANQILQNADSIVSVGRLSAQKGQLLLIEAFARVIKTGRKVKLVLVGDGELRKAIEQCIQEYQLNNYVEITGWTSGDQIRQLLRSARGFVLPSFAEGLPVVLMEAMAMGRPVVSTFVAGIPELVRDGVSGWLVPAGDVNALVEAINKLVDTPSDRLTQMGQAGIDTVRTYHQVQSEIDKLEFYLQEVC